MITLTLDPHVSLTRTSTSDFHSASPQFLQYESVVSALVDAGADQSRVVLANITGSLSRLQYWDAFLTRHPDCFLCIDGFGHGATFSPPPYADNQTSSVQEEQPSSLRYPPNDAEILTFTLGLCNRGHGSRVILSLSMFCKIQLEMYGGYGYGHIERTIKPSLRSMMENQHLFTNRAGTASSSGSDDRNNSDTVITDSTSSCGPSTLLQALTFQHAYALLRWRQPIKAQAVAAETLVCHVCGERFVGGEHYTKFQFEYCSSKCLASHRKNKWK